MGENSLLRDQVEETMRLDVSMRILGHNNSQDLNHSNVEDHVYYNL